MGQVVGLTPVVVRLSVRHDLDEAHAQIWLITSTLSLSRSEHTDGCSVRYVP